MLKDFWNFLDLRPPTWSQHPPPGSTTGYNPRGAVANVCLRGAWIDPAGELWGPPANALIGGPQSGIVA